VPYEYAMNIHVFGRHGIPLPGATVTIFVNDKPRVRGKTRGYANSPLKFRFNADAPTVRMKVEYGGTLLAEKPVPPSERDVTFNLEIDVPNQTLAQPWVMIVGAIIGTLTLVFLMALVILGTLGREVPCNSVYLVNATLSLGAALAAAFLGGNASARGALTIPLLRDNPIAVSASGGIAVLIIMLLLTSNLFGRTNCGPSVSVSCPVGMQSRVVDELRFAFCYPREAWELDSGPIDVRAADLYLRRSDDRDTGIHFHVSLIPPAWAGKSEAYTAEVARTWSQLDANIKQSKGFIGGRNAYVFSLRVKDRLGRSRPTEVTHIYLDPERLLEIISTWFDKTPASITDEIQQVKSSLTFART